MDYVNIRTGTRFQRIVLGILGAILALYCDQLAPQPQRPLIQAILWTFLVFAILIVELRNTLRRPRQLSIGLVLVAGHFYLLHFAWKSLPFRSSLSVMLLALLESVLIGLIYIRAGQSLDPEGPLGLSEEERRQIKLPKVL
jgi:hypothetical protein